MTATVDPDVTGSATDLRAVRKHRLAAAYRIFARLGFDEGAAGHITVRDPVERDTFWVAPFGRYFGAVLPPDLLRVDADGELVEGGTAAGGNRVNKAAFCIHSAIHAARPDVDGAAHAHGTYGRAFASLHTTLAPLSQDACAFYGSHALFPEFSGVVLDRAYGDRIAAALGTGRALVLANHGHLTAAASLEAAVWWFVAMERCFQVELSARAAGEPVPIPHETAQRTASSHSVTYAELCFDTLYQRILLEQPDLAATAP